MRILSGSARGARLLTDPRSAARPLMGRARASLFDILQPRLAAARFLDLFAGFGSVGLEAVSRGARLAVLVERDPQAAALIRRNIEKLRFGDRAELRQSDVFRALDSLAQVQTQFDLVFAGPPYGRKLARATLAAPALPQVLAAGGLAVVQHDRRDDPGDHPGPFRRLRLERYGDTLLSFYAAASAP